MFRIKKDDYNTVQLLPDFKSGSARRRKPKPLRVAETADRTERKVKTRNRMLAVIVILLTILVAVWFAYIHYFTEEAQYIRQFRHGEYTQCREMAESHAGDTYFQDKISSTVEGATDDAVAKYLAGEAPAEQTLKLLNRYNRASAGMFEQYIADNQHWIGTIESIYYKANQAAEEAQLGYYGESITKLQQVAEEAGKNALNLDQKITQILRDNLPGYKAQLFIQFASVIRNDSDYTVIRDIVSFVTKYIEDDDFREFGEVVGKVESGEVTKLTAARTARQIAKNAGADIEVEEGSGSAE